MDSSITRDVTDLVNQDKQSLEHILGAPLSEGQKVYVVAFTPGKEPDSQLRARAADAVERVLDEAADHARRQGVSDDQIDAAVDEAMGTVRRRNEA